MIPKTVAYLLLVVAGFRYYVRECRLTEELKID